MKLRDIIPNFDFPTEEEPTIEDYKILSSMEILLTMLSNIQKVNLVQTLRNDLQDELYRYRKKNTADEIEHLKVPVDLYIVAIVHEIGKVAVKNNWKIAKMHDSLYLYNGIFWQRVEDDMLNPFFGLAAAKIGFYSPAKARTHSFTKTGVAQIRSGAILMHRDNNDKTVRINLINGTLEITEKGHGIKAHNSGDFLTYALPFEYNPDVKAPLFKQYLKRVLPDISSQMVLQEFLGYVFIRHLKLEKAMILLGSGQNGKSVMFEIMTALFGKENVSTKSLGDLTDRDSGNDNRAKLGDKLLNYGSEIRGKDIDADIFKRLVSGEPVAAREKYKTGFDLENNCKFMFNANKLPEGAEKTDAYYRRFIIVPFNVKITEEEKDPELHTKIIKNELPGVLNWVIQGLNRLLTQKSFTVCRASEQELDRYKRENNNVLQFADDNSLMPDIKNFRLTKDVYKEYTSWCNDSGYRPVAINDFSKELSLLGFEYKRKPHGRGFYIS